MGFRDAPTAAPSAIAAALDEARERTLAIVASISDADLERVHSPLMSPLVWDLGHIAAFEDLWLARRLGGQPLLREELADIYDAFETPRSVRAEVPFLRPTAAREYLAEVRERTVAELERERPGASELAELVLRHEQQHGETMLQTVQLAQLENYTPAARRPTAECRAGGDATGLELVAVPGEQCTIGAPADRFAYDNERPCHRTDVRGYLIGHVPITNASYLTFVEGGGYERREWWTDEGWAWKEAYDIGRPAGWSSELEAEWRLAAWEPLRPDRPVVHVSWFEADAFARAHGARLPTEFEWEKAATWDQERNTVRTFPWGDSPPEPGLHANLDHGGCGPEPVHAHPAGVTPNGIEGLLGDVWEWTETHFDGYPGFEPHPYPQYSQVFFGTGYRVLRGGSWATRARVATPTFRNWDLPQRRQIFSGFRIARDLA
jgi:gamma-glutamyl hercynylcysteine S-oxide synthase